MRLETVQKTQSYTSPYSLDGRIPLRQAIPLGLQHVLAMFVGNLSPLLVIMATCGITDAGGFGALRIDLLQNAMLVAGLITFLQMYPIRADRRQTANRHGHVLRFYRDQRSNRDQRDRRHCGRNDHDRR